MKRDADTREGSEAMTRATKSWLNAIESWIFVGKNTESERKRNGSIAEMFQYLTPRSPLSARKRTKVIKLKETSGAPSRC